MAFIALRKVDGSRVDVTRLDDPREKLRGQEFECQLCGAQMFLRGGKDVRYHFYHQRSCTSDYATNPESPEHIAGKYFIAEDICCLLNEYANFEPNYEVQIPEVKRVADILIDFPMGWRIAHEIQLSSITVDELEKRTNDYVNAGIDTLWWFGKSADTATVREWAINKYGFSLSLNFDENQKVTTGHWTEDVTLDHKGFKYKYQKFTHQDAPSHDHIPPFAIRVAYWWLDHSLARYYQIWGKGNNALYERAFDANRRTIASFNGKTGAGKDKYFTKKGDYWYVDLQKFLSRLQRYNNIKPLSEEVVSNIKNRAKKRANKAINRTENTSAF